jgi:hypothetical protein
MVVRIPFFGQKARMSRAEAIESYILLRLRAEEIKRLSFLVEGLYQRTIGLPDGAPFSHSDLKDTVRTAFFGWLAVLTDKDDKAVYAFDPLLVLFPNKRGRMIKVQLECEACHGVLQQFRNNVAFHTRSKLAAHVKARRALIEEDTFLDLESARMDFQRLISEELGTIPELPKILTELGLARHPAFANIFPTEGSVK